MLPPSVVAMKTAEEVDRFTPNDPITPYRRVFPAPLDSALGEYGRWDEGSDGNDDPEQRGGWRFAYVIEALGGVVTPAT